MKTLIICFIMLLGLLVYAQPDSLNQRGKNGNKHGIWLVYLDSLVNPVASMEEAFFMIYEAYDHGRPIFKRIKDYNSDAPIMKYDGNWPKQGAPILIDGIFKWFTSDGRILQYEEYALGKPRYWKSYQYYREDIQTCGFNEILDWSKQYDEIEGTYYYEEIWRNKDVGVHGWFRPGNKGWKLYKIKEKN